MKKCKEVIEHTKKEMLKDNESIGKSLQVFKEI